MLPVYEAIQVIKVMPGGSTKPWLIRVAVDGKPKNYVVKLFKEEQVENASAVANEVFASVLAAEFDLKCPKAALINFSDSFYSNLTLEQRKELNVKDHRIKFGCEYIEGVSAYSDKVSCNPYEIESIYAFDLMLANWDRRIKKPNILIKGSNYILIDHDVGCQITEAHIYDFNNGKFLRTFSDHIFYKTLRNGKDRANYFHEFGEYLRTLKLSVLDNYADQLIEYNHPIGQFQVLKRYLQVLKGGYYKFEENLRKTLS